MHRSGQCAVGSTERISRFRTARSLSDKRIVRLFSGNGCEHLAALSASGELYTVGFNMRGQLGLGSTASVPEPTLVEAMMGHRVVDVACSYFHTVIVTSDGRLFACGRNDFGQLGIEDANDQLVPRPVSYFDRRPVLAVACGQHHTVVAMSTSI